MSASTPNRDRRGRFAPKRRAETGVSGWQLHADMITTLRDAVHAVDSPNKLTDAMWANLLATKCRRNHPTLGQLGNGTTTHNIAAHTKAQHNAAAGMDTAAAILSAVLPTLSNTA